MGRVAGIFEVLRGWIVCNFEATLGLLCWWVVLEDRGFFICAALCLCPRSGVQWWLHGVCAGFALRAAMDVVFTLCRCSGGSAPLHPRVGVGASRQKARARVQTLVKVGNKVAVCGGNGRHDSIRGDSGWWSCLLCLLHGCRYGLDTHRPAAVHSKSEAVPSLAASAVKLEAQTAGLCGDPKAGRRRRARSAGTNKGQRR
jgi:hypothetical protein